jgi:DNA-directed RNA polymerase specialized sigma24 family protein
MALVVSEQSFLVGRGAGLANPVLHAELKRFLARRLGDTDAEDLVQATLAEALASPNLPVDPEGVRRFVFGIARHKLIDHFRGRGRETSDDDSEAAAPSGDGVGVRDLMRWAERELPPEGDAQRTFEWMLREGDGERLEQIAEEEQIPAPRVRQRVSRLRRYLRARWVAQAAVLGLGTGLLVLLGYYAFSEPEPGQEIVRESPPLRPEIERARRLRALAFERCAAQDTALCLEQLDRARALDPAGDAEPGVQRARAAAKASPAPAPQPSASPPAIPSGARSFDGKGAELVPPQQPKALRARRTATKEGLPISGDSTSNATPTPAAAPASKLAPPSKAVPPSKPTPPAPRRMDRKNAAYDPKTEESRK